MAGSGTSVYVAAHRLVRRVDKGSFGEVWLAQTALGTYRAVKIIQRQGFDSSEPYERELRGIRLFEPISRSHPGFVPLLQVGQEEGFFYCVMEAANDLAHGQGFSEESYVPKTLERFRGKQALPPQECLRLGLQLADAVARLHDAHLVHRDIKPANIIFIHGYPKLADIGLVTDPNEANTLVGTMGFVPPEGSGKPQADVYALGKVLYECLTGIDRTRAPELPSLNPDAEVPPLLMELMEVVKKAIHPDPAYRYATARAMHADLLVLENGESVLRLRALEGMWARARKRLKIAAAAAALVAMAFAWQAKERRLIEQEREQRIGQDTALGMLSWDGFDYGSSLANFASAAAQTEGRPNHFASQFRLVSTLMRMPRLGAEAQAGADLNCMDVTPSSSGYCLGLRNGSIQIRQSPSLDLWFSAELGAREVSSCQIHPNGRLAAVATSNGKVHVLDVNERKPGLSWVCEKADAVAFSRRTNWLYTGSLDGMFSTWDPTTGRLLQRLRLGTKPLDSIACATNVVGVASRDGTIYAFPAEGGSTPIWTNQRPFDAYCLALSPDGSLLSAGFDDGKAVIWATATGVQALAPLKHLRGITSVSFSPDGMLIVTTSFDGATKVWSALSGAQEYTALPHPSHVRAAGFSPDGRRILIAGFDGSLRLWDLAGQQLPEKIPRQSLLLDGGARVSMDPSRKSLVFGAVGAPDKIAADGAIEQLAPLIGKNRLLVLSQAEMNSWMVRSLDAESRRMSAWAIHRNGARPRLEAGSNAFCLILDRRVESFSAADGLPTGRVEHLNSTPVSATPPDRGWGAVCAGTNVILFRETSQTVLPHDLPTSRAVFSADGSKVAVCTRTSAIQPCYAQVWDCKSGKPLSPRLPHTDGVLDASWSANGGLLVTVDEDGFGIIWDTQTWKPQPRMLRHGDPIASVTLGSSPEMILTASSDRTCRFWDPHTGLPLSPPFTMSFDLSSARFVRDGMLAVESGGDSWLWKLPNIQDQPRLLRGELVSFATTTPRPGSNGQAPRTVREEVQAALPAPAPTTSEEVSRWHQLQADVAMVNYRGTLEAYHMRKVVEANPHAFGASNQLANALERAKKQP